MVFIIRFTTLRVIVRFLNDGNEWARISQSIVELSMLSKAFSKAMNVL